MIGIAIEHQLRFGDKLGAAGSLKLKSFKLGS